MFSSSSEHLKQKAMHESSEIKGYLDGYAEYKKFVEKTTNKIFSNPLLFRNVLKTSATDYLNATRYDWFRSAGKTRGDNLQRSAHEAKDLVDSITALKEAIKEGAEKPDSLKTFIYNLIQAQSSFCDRTEARHFRSYPMKISAEQFLNDIVKLAEADQRYIDKQAEKHAIKVSSEVQETAPELIDHLSNIISNY
jgi:hypothetical protein